MMQVYRQRGYLTAATVLLVLAVGCFSERGTTTSPDVQGTCDIPLADVVPGATLIVIRDFSFEPREVTTKAGGTVSWVNCSSPSDPAHTATADQGLWGSAEFATGESFSVTLSQAGRFPYHCEPHPFMTGEVIVE